MKPANVVRRRFIEELANFLEELQAENIGCSKTIDVVKGFIVAWCEGSTEAVTEDKPFLH